MSINIWFWSAVALHFLLAAVLSLRIITETRSPAKTLAYLLLVFFLPFIGILIYLLVGINYRKLKLYNKKLVLDQEFFRERRLGLLADFESSFQRCRSYLGDREFVARLLAKDGLSPVHDDTKVSLLINGERKYPALLEALEAATDHIHMEYYIFDSDETGEAVAEVLLRKAAQGVKVRVIYDDFGSKSMSNSFERRLRNGGVEIFAFYKIYLILLARRLNYRDHRKIVVIDGKVGFLGGINISNHYSNAPEFSKSNKFYWRDTHLKLEGSAVYSLQYIFLSTWNFCSDQNLKVNDTFFPVLPEPRPHEEIVQIVSSGPDSRHSSILLSFIGAIMTARKRIRITTPYFIPNSSLMETLRTAAMAGVEVELLVPRKSDTRIVDLAAVPYYQDLLQSGVKVYRYKKGFVHAKTMTVDGELSIVGTANMDLRSFDFNFEVNAVIYGKRTAEELDRVFDQDIKESEVVNSDKWKKSGMLSKVEVYVWRLLSSLL